MFNKSFLEYFNESKNLTKISLIIGRFQPFNAGHYGLTANAKHHVLIAVVRGEKSSQDKKKNPFSEELQIEVIEKANVKDLANIKVFKTGFLPEIISSLEDDGYEVMEIVTGSDREETYKTQLEKYKDDIGDIKLKVVDRESSTSSTEIRKYLLDGDYESVKENMINLDEDLYEKMVEEINQSAD